MIYRLGHIFKGEVPPKLDTDKAIWRKHAPNYWILSKAPRPCCGGKKLK